MLGTDDPVLFDVHIERAAVESDHEFDKLREHLVKHGKVDTHIVNQWACRNWRQAAFAALNKLPK